MSNIQPREDNVPSLSSYDERLEEFENIPLDNPKYSTLPMRQRQMCLMYVLKDQTGMTAKEIAEKFEISRTMLYKFLRKYEAQMFMHEVSNQILSETFTIAVLEMKKILKTSHSESNKIKVIEMIMKTQGKFKNELDVNVKQEHVFDLEKEKREIIEIDVDEIE
ncbi:helix-turn-helix domain-containing protein [Fictibacillus sp. KIGAM418]|uniref:Helix-turn-helix domain-containing protein n=1 Tax=Fictibacillus marinisediminis TaxID=2878389 RepID=A0A9X1X9P8_9BACL|nr:phBC6A51 family helix-turn-helix protein [Fictibacillus marinisediminis]MCK6256822.1 helix-turn-helix domain-containing protein [Fictibacillus marinisediminis]